MNTVCPCAGKIPPGYVPEGVNNTEPFQPIATNGQPFPWLQPYLPSHIRPIRYTLTIHPNLTTLDVKGKFLKEIFYVDLEKMCNLGYLVYLIQEEHENFSTKNSFKRFLSLDLV